MCIDPRLPPPADAYKSPHSPFHQLPPSVQRHPPDQLLLAPTPPALQKLLGEQARGAAPRRVRCGGGGGAEVLASPRDTHVAGRPDRRRQGPGSVLPRGRVWVWAGVGGQGSVHQGTLGSVWARGGCHSGVLLHQVGGREAAVPWTAHGGDPPRVLSVGQSQSGMARPQGNKGHVRAEHLPPCGTRWGPCTLLKLLSPPSPASTACVY